MEEKELKDVLLRESEEFKKVYLQHQEYEKRLEKFKQKDFLTEKEKFEEKELKKKKLALKDKMYFILTEYKKSLQK